MKQYINSFMLALSITCNLQASLPVKYWNDNVHTPKSTIQKNIPLKEKCKQTVAMIKERKTVNLEKSIPLLMEVYTHEIHTQPKVILTKDSKEILIEANNILNQRTKQVTCEPIYKVFKGIINNEPILQEKNLSLREAKNDSPDGQISRMSGYTTFSTIVICPEFNIINDGLKLFILNHELQHQRNGDCDNRRTIHSLRNTCILSDLQKTPYVQAILKSNIKNVEGKNLQDLLEENTMIVKNEIARYQEFRADTRAIENMQCPHCIEEASLAIPNHSGYEEDGYINQWQFQPRIDQLKKQGTICQHHYENDEQIDTSICDGSTLAKRMIIVQKNK